MKQRFTIRAVIAVVALVAATFVSIGEPQSAEAQSADTTQDFAHRAAVSHFQAQIGTPPRAEAVAIAREHDLVIGHWRTFQGNVQAMKAANPNLTILVYQKGATAPSDEGSKYPESWYLRNAQGRKVQSDPWGSYLMDPRITGWRNNVVSECRDDIERSGYDGCYFDVMGVGALSIVSSAPLLRSGGPEISKEQWHDMMVGLAGHVRTQLPARFEVMGNTLGAGRRYVHPDFPASEVADELGKAHAEVWMRLGFTPATQFRTVDEYRLDLDILTDSSARGNTALVTTKLWASANERQRTQWRNLSYASFLLATDGSHFFAFTGEESTMEVEHPLYDLDIGVPTGDYSDTAAGVFQRRFTGGLVITNAGSSTRTVSLPTGNFVDVDGTTYSQSVQLAAHTGLVLRASGGRGGPPVPTPTPGPGDNVPLCSGEVPTIVGTSSGDRLVGTAGRDIIWGGDGNDVIDGRGGDDVICGGKGNDRLSGGEGNDVVIGGHGNDQVRGQTGNDRLFGGDGTDQCFGSKGRDTARFCESTVSVP